MRMEMQPRFLYKVQKLPCSLLTTAGRTVTGDLHIVLTQQSNLETYYLPPLLFERSWQGGICRIILFLRFSTTISALLPSVCSRSNQFYKYAAVLKEILGLNEVCTSSGLACWVQTTESSRRVNVSAFRNCLSSVSLLKCMKAVCKGGLLPSGFALLPGAQERWEGSFISSLFLELTQWFFQQVPPTGSAPSRISHTGTFFHISRITATFT